jgi:hypothetical protein
MNAKILSFLCTFAVGLPLLGQTPQWSHTFEVPDGHKFAFPTDKSGTIGRSGIEMLNDGVGGTLWVLHFEPNVLNPDRKLDRVLWLSATGIPIWTNDFLLNTSDDFIFPIQLVDLTKTDAILQYTSGIAGDFSGVNSAIKIKKSKLGAVSSDTPLPARENIGAVAGQNGAADRKGFFTRQPIGGPDSLSATSVVIRRYSR